MAAYSPAQFIALVQTLAATVQSLQAQLEWFQRQTFGTKSERLRVLENAQQLALGEVLVPPSQKVPAKERLVAAHTRRESQKDAAVGEADSVPFFDEVRVPVETIELPDPQTEGLSPDDYEVISQKVSYRLAQRPGSYVILKYLRSVTKRRDTQTMSCAPAPVGVIEGSRADVSFVVGLLVDKFAYHLPLYRQHQRLLDSGVQVSRPWLTQLSQQSIALLEPIYNAQFDSIRSDRVKAMDETPIKAGRKERGKMKIGYFVSFRHGCLTGRRPIL
jgi:transposase